MIVAVTDGAGASLAINTYDEYGIPDTAAGDDIATKGRFRFTGQMWLPELEMYHYKARIYFYKLGRFLQTDPIGYEDQLNLYAYVGNDPINGVDPTGMVQTKAASSNVRISGNTCSRLGSTGCSTYGSYGGGFAGVSKGIGSQDNNTAKQSESPAEPNQSTGGVCSQTTTICQEVGVNVGLGSGTIGFCEASCDETAIQVKVSPAITPDRARIRRLGPAADISVSPGGIEEGLSVGPTDATLTIKTTDATSAISDTSSGLWDWFLSFLSSPAQGMSQMMRCGGDPDCGRSIE